jgi:hypothetical protein
MFHAYKFFKFENLKRRRIIALLEKVLMYVIEWCFFHPLKLHMHFGLVTFYTSTY